MRRKSHRLYPPKIKIRAKKQEQEREGSRACPLSPVEKILFNIALPSIFDENGEIKEWEN